MPKIPVLNHRLLILVASVLGLSTSGDCVFAEEPLRIEPTDEQRLAAIKKFEKLGGRIETIRLPGSGNVVITLDLENTDFTDADLKGVSSIGAVSDLVLSDCKGVTDARMKELANLNSLAQLWLGGTDVTDTGLKELGNLKKLTILSLTGCNTVTDVGVKELARLNNLTILDLSSTQVTDTGVKELAGLTTLSDLKLDDTQASSWINT